MHREKDESRKEGQTFFYPQQMIYSINITMFTCTIVKQLSIFKEQVQGPRGPPLEGFQGSPEKQMTDWCIFNFINES